MAKELFPSSYECDCGHQLHFFENTVRGMKEMSLKKRVRLREGGDAHTVVFHKGEMVEIFCPVRGETFPNEVNHK